MTNEEMFDDLKQFIDGRFSQQDTEFVRKLDQKLKEKLAPVNKKLDDLVEFVTDAIDTTNDETGKQLTNHEQRITKLEHKAV
jgi:hypothetical protein